MGGIGTTESGPSVLLYDVLVEVALRSVKIETQEGDDIVADSTKSEARAKYGGRLGHGERPI